MNFYHIHQWINIWCTTSNTNRGYALYTNQRKHINVLCCCIINTYMYVHIHSHMNTPTHNNCTHYHQHTNYLVKAPSLHNSRHLENHHQPTRLFQHNTTASETCSVLLYRQIHLKFNYKRFVLRFHCFRLKPLLNKQITN